MSLDLRGTFDILEYSLLPLSAGDDLRILHLT